MDEYLIELQSGGIRFRDKWQFELKSDLFPFSESRTNIHTQEFYIFIPNSLQINDQTYKKEEFYRDQTNLIRFKTPQFSLEEMTSLVDQKCPLGKISSYLKRGSLPEDIEAIQNELKLLGDIFNSALRNQVGDFIKRLPYLVDSPSSDEFAKDFSKFCEELDNFLKAFKKVEKESLASYSDPMLRECFFYIEEFLNREIYDYLANFLNRLRKTESAELASIDRLVCEILIRAKRNRQEPIKEESELSKDKNADEYILYRKGLLNKFVIDPLLLKTNRSSVDQRYRNVIGGIPAAVAMLIYLLLFIWQGNVFLFNSEPFILLTVVIYVLKDRLKEELRFLSYRQAAKWFSDYTTEIHSNGQILGDLRESFSFVNEHQIPKEILSIRNKEFHGIMEAFQRPEQVIYYKKTVRIQKKPKMIETRFYGLSIIFRFDIHHFLSKTEDPYQTYLDLDEMTLAIRKLQLPRVYHLNIIMKTTSTLKDESQKIELKKFRLVVDKTGIKRVEPVHSVKSLSPVPF